MNLRWLCEEDPRRFANEILPLLSSAIYNTAKDDEMQRKLATSMEVVIDLKKIDSKAMIALADKLMNNLRHFNKKQKHEVWDGCLCKIVSIYTAHSHE